MTQEAFAELIGISVDFLSLIERGINAPSFETLDQIGDRLGVPVKDLFEFANEERKPTAAHPPARRRAVRRK
jgi:transcriptional regulator with XRE-family HTH domain